MASLERKTSAFSQRSLFSSSQPDEILPSEHRSSIVDEPHGRIAMQVPFTKALLDSHPEEFKQATEAPFLRLAGLGRLPKVQLSRWLSQDRLYAETYICFITSLMARVNLPYAYVADKSQSLRWRILNVLNGALQNIHTELDFFTSTAKKYDLRLDQPPRDDDESFFPEEATRQYIDLFRSFYNDATLPLIEGLLVLWATEQCYHSAWTYASKFMQDSAAAESLKDDADGGALREAFIPNWTSDEFAKFVDEIAEITDLLADREQAGRKLEVHKAVWLHVLDIEKRFWPVVDENAS